MSFSSMPPLFSINIDAETETSKGLLTDEEVPPFRPHRASKVDASENVEEDKVATGTNTSTDDDDTWISKLVPRTTFIFVRHTQADFKFFKGATHKYELVNANGVRILFGKESPSKERHIGIGVHVVIHVLTLTGEEVFRMEGHRGGPRPTGEDNLIFDIFGPHGRTRIGGIGLGVAKFFPEIPIQLDKCMGIELVKSSEMKDKLILMAAMFIRPIPQSNSDSKQDDLSSSNNNANNDNAKIVVTSGGDDGNSIQVLSDPPDGFETKSTSMDSLTQASATTTSFEEITVYDD